MPTDTIFDQSERLASELVSVLSVPGYDSSPRNQISYLASSLSLEHWHATRALLREGLLPSGLVVLRAQYEALVRAVWALYAATESHIDKLATSLTTDSEQAAKNLPQIADMLGALSTKAPPQPIQALTQFKNTSWKALNSYAHAGIHPLHRHEQGYPIPLVEQVTRNSNGLAVVAGMQAAVLSGSQALVLEVGTLQHKHASCLPPRNDV